MANMDTAKYGLAALTPAMLRDQEQAQYQGSGPNPYNFAFDWERPQGPSYDSREALQLRGRLRSLAEGGPVGEMSEKNAALTLMANGGQMFAEGGETGKGGMSKFLQNIGSVASKDGTMDIRTGQVTPWSESNPKPTVGFFGQPLNNAPAAATAPSQYQGMTGASADAMRYLMGEAPVSPATQAARSMQSAPVMAPIQPLVAQSQPAGGQSGYYEDDPNQPFAFNFNPATGQMTPAPRPQRYVEPTAVFDPVVQYAGGGLSALAGGGQSHLGDYSDGGRLLRGPGDGVSDSIPATIADKRPARLADGEFVVPARIVSELGNGSTEAGARKLYAMMDRIQKARGKTVGKDRVAVNSRADKALPA
jgi:hypothetical protein